VDAHGGKQKIMTVSADEFLRRFLIHVLPRGLVRIPHFGFFANRRRGDALSRCRILLGEATCASDPQITTQPRCPVCGNRMLIIERLTSSQLFFRSISILPVPRRCTVDSS
jgi:DNA-directed RNA polymerase subunit RPC12/RpoP